jgi:CRISPR-associated protein Cas5t
MKALHVRLEGFSASFRHPLIISGTQLSTPVPSYSNLLGMISACAGDALGPEDTGRIGFEFKCRSHDLEIERKDRWEVSGDRLQPVSKKSVPRVLRRVTATIFEEMPQGVGSRQVYWEPELDLFIENVDLLRRFTNPAATPCFGRSQDIAWIRWVRLVELNPVEGGFIGPTLIPYPQPGVPGVMLRLPEWFRNDRKGRPRRPGPFGHYQAMLPTTKEIRFHIERPDLFHPSYADTAETAKHVIYLHRWMTV